jgi:hypothetical protein
VALSATTLSTVTTATACSSCTAIASGGITAASIAADAIGASELAADAVDEVWDEAQSGHTTAGTFGYYLDARVSTAGGGGCPTANAIADQVWDEAIAGHLSAGSTGQSLNAAGGSGDPWITSIPGSYTAGQAGYVLGNEVRTKALLIGSGLAIVTTPVAEDGTITIIQGDDYRIADGKQIVISVTDPIDLTGATVALRVVRGATVLVNDTTETIATATGATKVFHVELTRTETAAFPLGAASYRIRVTLSGGDVITMEQGDFIVQRSP